MSTDKYPTASAVLPLQHVLISQLKKRREPGARTEPDALKEMKGKIITDLEKRYGHQSDGFKLLNKASYLDPRFHLLVHLNAGQKQEVSLAFIVLYLYVSSVLSPFMPLTHVIHLYR